jgi:hypothetical protein
MVNFYIDSILGGTKESILDLVPISDDLYAIFVKGLRCEINNGQ